MLRGDPDVNRTEDTHYIGGDERVVFRSEIDGAGYDNFDARMVDRGGNEGDGYRAIFNQGPERRYSTKLDSHSNLHIGSDHEFFPWIQLGNDGDPDSVGTASIVDAFIQCGS